MACPSQPKDGKHATQSIRKLLAFDGKCVKPGGDLSTTVITVKITRGNPHLEKIRNHHPPRDDHGPNEFFKPILRIC
jgi:hypothetical protein